MHLRQTLLAAPFAIAVLVGGCTAGGPTVRQPTGAQPYLQGDFQTAVSRGAIPTVVMASPGTTGHEAFAERVRDYMRLGAADARARFVPRLGAPTPEEYSMVLMFNGPIGVSARQLCAIDARFPTRPIGERIYLQAAFCYGDGMLSEAEGELTGITGPNDPRIRTLVSQIVLALHPTDDRWDSDRGFGMRF